ncbi:MAG: proton-conducting transporter membrane subunit [Candidatus Thermoplasmatota archaeon]
MIEHVPILIIISPLTGALLLELISRFNPPDKMNDVITLVALAVPVVLLFSFTPAILEEPIVYELGGWEKPYGLSLVLDNLSVMLAGMVGTVTLSSFVYSLESKDMLPKGERYYFLFLFMTTGLYGVFLTGDLINRYIFFELTILTTYVLLTYTRTKESLRASYYYLMIGSVASFLFLAGIALIYFNVGYLDLRAIGEVLPTVPIQTRILIFSFFMVAIGVKSGLIPFHTWLPDAHVSAPTPITAVLAGLTVKVGIYILFRILKVGFAISPILNIVIFFGLFTGIIGSLMTFKYWDIKRILTWHTIAQMGFITACIGIWSPSSVSAALYHTVNHSVFKTLLFLSAGSFIFLYGSGDIRDLTLKRGHPILASTLIIGLLSLLGVPPMNGFYSKAFILQSALSRPVVLLPLLLIHIITAASVFRIVYHASHEIKFIEAPVSMMKPLVVLAGLAVFMGTTTTIWMNNIVIPAGTVLVGEKISTTANYLEYSTLTSTGGLLLLGTLPVGFVLYPVFEKVKDIEVKRVISEVSLTDAVRYILIGQGIVIALILFY